MAKIDFFVQPADMRSASRLIDVKCAAVWLFAALLGAGAAQAAPDADYRIIETSGQAGLAAGGGELSPASAGCPLESGDRLVTGSDGRIELASVQGTVIEIGPSSEFEVEDVSSPVEQFYLRVGRFLSRFAHASPGGGYRVRTPTAVAAVRGTEFALNVGAEGETQGGVVEGAVGFTPEGADADAAPEALVGASQGVAVGPRGAVRRLEAIPPVFAPSLRWFPAVRERIPELRKNWKALDRPARLALRQQALRERIRWTPPERPSVRFERPARLSPRRRPDVGRRPGRRLRRGDRSEEK